MDNLQKYLDLLSHSNIANTDKFVATLTPILINEFKELYSFTLTSNEIPKLILREFQSNLKSISYWSEDNIKNKFKSLTPDLKRLIKFLFENYYELHHLLNNHDNYELKFTKYELIYECYLNVARHLWKYPTLYYHNVDTHTHHDNYLSLEKSIKEIILKSLSTIIPFEQKLYNYKKSLIKQSKPYNPLNNDEDNDDNDDDDEDDDDDDDESDDDSDDDNDDDYDENDNDNDDYDGDENGDEDEVANPVINDNGDEVANPVINDNGDGDDVANPVINDNGDEVTNSNVNILNYTEPEEIMPETKCINIIETNMQMDDILPEFKEITVDDVNLSAPQLHPLTDENVEHPPKLQLEQRHHHHKDNHKDNHKDKDKERTNKYNRNKIEKYLGLSMDSNEFRNNKKKIRHYLLHKSLGS